MSFWHGSAFAGRGCYKQHGDNDGDMDVDDDADDTDTDNYSDPCRGWRRGSSQNKLWKRPPGIEFPKLNSPAAETAPGACAEGDRSSNLVSVENRMLNVPVPDV